MVRFKGFSDVSKCLKERYCYVAFSVCNLCFQFSRKDVVVWLMSQLRVFTEPFRTDFFFSFFFVLFFFCFFLFISLTVLEGEPDSSNTDDDSSNTQDAAKI